MNTKLLTACLLTGALILPMAGYGEDKDTDRSSPKNFVKDSVITTKIKAELAEEKLSSLVHISVDTDAKGRVVLGGTAESKAAASKAVSIARSVEGVVAVQNNIRIKAAQ